MKKKLVMLTHTHKHGNDVHLCYIDADKEFNTEEAVKKLSIDYEPENNEEINWDYITQITDLHHTKANESNEQPFVRDFDSWHETHFEVVSNINSASDPGADNLVTRTEDNEGTGGIYELAEELTNEFEKLNANRDWDGEFYDEIEAFCNQKIYNEN